MNHKGKDMAFITSDEINTKIRDIEKEVSFLILVEDSLEKVKSGNSELILEGLSEAYGSDIPEVELPKIKKKIRFKTLEEATDYIEKLYEGRVFTDADSNIIKYSLDRIIGFLIDFGNKTHVKKPVREMDKKLQDRFRRVNEQIESLEVAIDNKLDILLKEKVTPMKAKKLKEEIDHKRRELTSEYNKLTKLNFVKNNNYEVYVTSGVHDYLTYIGQRILYFGRKMILFLLLKNLSIVVLTGFTFSFNSLLAASGTYLVSLPGSSASIVGSIGELFLSLSGVIEGAIVTITNFLGGATIAKIVFTIMTITAVLFVMGQLAKKIDDFFSNRVTTRDFKRIEDTAQNIYVKYKAKILQYNRNIEDKKEYAMLKESYMSDSLRFYGI